MKKIRVLQFGSSMGLYGAERWILALIRYCNPNEIENVVAVIRDSPSGLVAVADHAKTMGFDTDIITARGPFDPTVILKIVALIKKKKIDIIHTHSYKSDTIGIIAAKMAGVPVVSTPHGIEINIDLKLKIYLALGFCLIKWGAAKVVPLSDSIFEHYLKLGMPQEKMEIIKNGVDILEIEEKKQIQDFVKLREEKKIKIIGYVGQFIERKGITYLIEALKEVAGVLDVKLFMAGNGPLIEEIKKQIKDLGLDKNVELLGFRTDRIEIMKSCDLFVLPSLSEGIPRVLMEAMAARVPVISTDIPGVRELIRNEENGILVPARSPEMLAEKMIELLKDKEKAEKLAANAYDWVRENYSGERMAKEYTKLFYEVAIK